LTVVEN
jgi:hypothetical protein